MIPFAAKTEVKLALLVAFGAACFAGGWAVEGWRMGARIAGVEVSEAKRDQSVAEANLAQVVAGEVRGDALVERVAHEETHRDQINQEKSRVVRSFVTGRPCLAGAAVRLLNLPDGIQPGAVSEAASESLPGDAGAATDLDIVEWIGLCKRSYNTCRGRLQAIHDFFGGSAVRDDVDRAQAREQEMRQDALAEHAREAQKAAAVDSAEFCAMCGEAIPEGRRDAVPGVQTCIDCQKDVERLGMRVR